MTKPKKWHVRPAKTQISLHIHPVESVFAVCMKKAWVLSYPLGAQQRLIRLGGCPGWSESLLGAHSILLVCHALAGSISARLLSHDKIPQDFRKHIYRLTGSCISLGVLAWEEEEDFKRKWNEILSTVHATTSQHVPNVIYVKDKVMMMLSQIFNYQTWAVPHINKPYDQGPVVQSIVSLTSLLRVISLTV